MDGKGERAHSAAFEKSAAAGKFPKGNAQASGTNTKSISAKRAAAAKPASRVASAKRAAGRAPSPSRTAAPNHAAPQKRGGSPRRGGKPRPRRKFRLRWPAFALLAALAIGLMFALLPRAKEAPEAPPEATMEPSATPQPTATPEPGWSPQPMGEIADGAKPDSAAYNYQYRILADGQLVDSYQRESPISMGEGEDYAQVEGILTFRGNNYRDTAAYGTVPDDANGLEVVWSKKIGGIDNWVGVGWTGQASIVRWPEETRRLMNINAEKKEKDGLKEVIYGTLDGHIYFLDLDDGKATRDPIAVPSSIKGSVSVDPRGLPLLYCGQGIDTVKGHDVELGTRIFSLIDQKKLFFLDGRDEFSLRHWYAADCSPLVDAGSDTLIHLGENGITYTIKLNSNFDPQTGALSIDPVVDRLVYKSKISKRPGMENSPAIYDHYAYYTDNSGLLVCLDLNTMSPVWLGDVGDDSDASIVIEEDADGVWLYTACELDFNGLTGDIYCRKFNALTGEEIWKIPVPCSRYKEDVEAGSYATPAVGKGSLSRFVYFNIARTSDGGGRLGAVDKQTGEVVWQIGTGGISWSSPVCVYDSKGRGYLIYCNSKGNVRLLDGLTGEQLAEVTLDANIEASPAVFDDMLVIGTWGAHIYGVRITS